MEKFPGGGVGVQVSQGILSTTLENTPSLLLCLLTRLVLVRHNSPSPRPSLSPTFILKIRETSPKKLFLISLTVLQPACLNSSLLFHCYQTVKDLPLLQALPHIIAHQNAQTSHINCIFSCKNSLKGSWYLYI